MPELKMIYENLGFKNPETYIQSGNVLFTSQKEMDTALLEKKIETAITNKTGYLIPVIVRSLEEMQNISTRNPFLRDPDTSIEKLYVTYLKDLPLSTNLDKIKSINYPPDQYVIIGKEVFIYCPDRYGETKLSNTFFENKLKVAATTRNWKTLITLINMKK